MRHLIETANAAEDIRRPAVLTTVRARVTAPVNIRWHRNDRGQAILVTAGLLTVQTRQGDWVVPGGHCFWVPPGEEHCLRLHGEFTGFYVYVSPGACPDLPMHSGTAATPALLREAIIRTVGWTDGPLAGTPDARIEALVLDELQALPMQREYLPMPAHPALMRIARMVLADPADPRSLESLADEVHLSRRTVTRRFVQEVGLSFSAWRQRVRLLQAIQMLAVGTPVTTIALDLGYDSPSAFTAMFRRQLGTTPSRFLAERAAEPVAAVM